MKQIDFITKKLSVDFFDAQLVQQTEKFPIVYKGCAHVYSKGDDVFVKMYTQTASPEQEIDLMYMGRPFGTLISKDEYFKFVGEDFNGNTWEADDIRVNGKSQTDHEKGVKIIETKVPKIRQVRKVGMARWRRYWVKGNIDLPARGRSEQEGAVCCRLCVDKGQLVLKNEGDITLILVDEAIDEGSDEVILEALSIALGKDCAWSLKECKKELVYWSGRQDYVEDRLLAPFNMYPYRINDFERFIKCYLKCNHDKIKEFYDRWGILLNSSRSFIDLKALSVASVVEGVAAKLYGDVSVSKDEKDSINKIEEYILQDEFLSTEWKERIQGMLKNAKNPKQSNAGILHELRKNKVITQKDITSWGALRNRLAHGKLSEWHRGKKQKTLNDYFTCLHLLYVLLFNYIGYEGLHRDYSQPGFPEAEFSFCKLPLS
ncbi:hypothetical protein LWC08_06470 [Desulfobaculum bizertense]|uniref:hypothetical protein n=1 Tax=Desulfobaculum bizertense TaxID=376490 RepID=UPI001F4058D7|nr:hypothetical protein [Desulfobaculum bizertense]UIJ39212.1 hypothetical protein LWC08_06470 [Desulfobaculum bizertense]